jgi:AbrB family looped-hinge helix DNA binding protein
MREAAMATTVSSKGQVVIPKPVRKALGILPGVQVEFDVTGAEARLKVVRGKVSRLEDGFGMIKHRGPPVSVAQMSGTEAARRLAKRGRLKP